MDSAAKAVREGLTLHAKCQQHLSSWRKGPAVLMGDVTASTLLKGLLRRQREGVGSHQPHSTEEKKKEREKRRRKSKMRDKEVKQTKKSMDR